MKNRPTFSSGFVWLPLLLAILGVLVVSGGAYWYVHPNTMFQASTPEIAPTATTTSTGIITGNISYPSTCIQPQIVCAVDTQDNSKKYCSGIIKGGCVEEGATVQDSFSVQVPPGNYYVYAALSDRQTQKAYYDEFVTCGYGSQCSEAGHSLYVPVQVLVGQTISGITPGDWYASQETTSTETTIPGMSQYTDTDFGFSFWYPSGWNIRNINSDESNYIEITNGSAAAIRVYTDYTDLSKSPNYAYIKTQGNTIGGNLIYEYLDRGGGAVFRIPLKGDNVLVVAGYVTKTPYSPDEATLYLVKTIVMGTSTDTTQQATIQAEKDAYAGQ